MEDKPRGLYETLITEALAARLRELDRRLHVHSDDLRPADAADRIALHLGRIVQRALGAVEDGRRGRDRDRPCADARRRDRGARRRAGTSHDAPVESGTVLRAILARLPDGTPEVIPEPLIPLLDTTLLTNAPGEPRVGSQVLAEIHSADRIDVVMAFIRRSGIAPLLDALRAHCEAGRALRVLTTTYTGSTEARALDALRDLGADVRVSYDTTTTRLHAKAWLFHRARASRRPTSAPRT